MVVHNLSRDAHISSNSQTAAISFVVLFFVWWVVLAYFHLFPGVDIAIAQYFSSEPACVVSAKGTNCESFPYSQIGFLVWLRWILLQLPYGIVAFLLWAFFRSLRKGKTQTLRDQRRMIVIALVAFALGPGLIVNRLLKTYGGRPRPRDVTLFGGDLDFVQAGSFAGKCHANCSFVSGEASFAGWLLCLVVLLPRELRLPLGLPMLIVSVAIPVMRVVVGAHFLSDVVLGWLLSVVVFAGMTALFGPGRPMQLRNALDS